jgi:protein-tyrosine phosphatase
LSNLAFDLFTPDGIKTAISLLADGDVLALPTDTVAGLVVAADLAGGAAKLSVLKGSDSAKTYSWHIGSLPMLQRLSPNLPAGIHPWLLESLQQQCTVLLPSSMFAIPSTIDWQSQKVGLRWPQNVDFQNVAEEYGMPLLATSVNDSGQPPMVGEELIEWLEQKKIPYAMQLLDSSLDGKASSVVDVLPTPKVLRGDPAKSKDIGLSILMLCTGNTCRSPLAAEILKIEIASSWQVSPEDLSDFGFVIESAGTFALEGQGISENSKLVGNEIGLDLSSHQTQSLEAALNKPWDIILVMSANHLAALPPESPAALFDLSGQDISDPMGGNIEQYRDTRDRLQEAAQLWVSELSSWPQH